jgi:hypothetical protein
MKLIKEFLEALFRVNISFILSFPLVGNPSGVMLCTEQYSKAKRDSGLILGKQGQEPE